MGKLDGKVAVVTGASKGIGAEIGRTLAAEGASVVVNYASSREGADRVVADITAAGGKAIAMGGDVSKSDDVTALFDAAKQTFGRVDILINNAGVFDFKPLEEITEAHFERHFRINVLGPILTTQAAVKHFPSSGGVIINVSSVVAFSPVPNSSVYSATKGALDTLTRTYAQELGPRNIRVVSLNPGLISTEGSQSLGVIGSPFEQQVIAETPLRRVGLPADIAKVAAFLASDDAGWITGEIITASGGHS
ncbi:glucose 1-dehydrogenase [Hyphomicrobium sp. D-2]|uniref:SDR family NAD(P)-dependent oxidoreductase n=1 Tax=Hyphomicrobium sp. D-2 TaxID=3041621 RepID=UPI002456CAD2|nr:glucose 1-dehydrogenase [Hyphomicrobium sp. D-2]MDH4982980.1 glucose 1-dehydrogenase [Hyphomicrobium sp. D-2]